MHDRHKYDTGAIAPLGLQTPKHQLKIIRGGGGNFLYFTTFPSVAAMHGVIFLFYEKNMYKI